MTKVTIIPETPGSPGSAFRASSGKRESVGQTPGAALDALTEQLTEAEGGTLVVVQNMRPDSFFTAAQQTRLGELMAKWREARTKGLDLNNAEQAELEALIEIELDGSAGRAERWLENCSGESAISSRCRGADHRCEYCRAPEVLFNFPFEIEHIIPSSDAAPADIGKLALSCRSCNVYKSKHMTGIDILTGETVRLFHPRQDQWAMHFVVSENFTITGLSSIGRATISRLNLNSAKQISSRRKWRILKQFP